MALKKMCLPIYLDYQATTPVDPRVLEVMVPYFVEYFGNASSRQHEYGWTAEAAVEKARRQVAALIGATEREIIFTSGATESNNLAILGVAEALRGQGRHIVTSNVEHRAVLDPCRALEARGFEVTYLRADSDGRVSANQVLKAIRPDTILVTVMAANNEIGSLNPIAEIGEVCCGRGVYFHTDAVQACGRISIDVDAMKIDLLSISGHKMYAPKGVGALYVRRKNRRVELATQIHGGGHERGLRSGTVNVPGIVGLGKAAEICHREMHDEGERLQDLAYRFWTGLRAKVGGLSLNGHPTARIPGTLNLAIEGVESGPLMMTSRSIAVSSGSACASAEAEPSHVLRAIGLSDDKARTCIRMSVGRPTTEQEVDFAIEEMSRAVIELRRASPLYDMDQSLGGHDYV